MKVTRNIWLALAAPFLILIAFFGFLQRNGNDRLQALPALVVGCGLIGAGILERQKRRKKILLELRKVNENND